MYATTKTNLKIYEAVEDGQEVLVGNGNTSKVERKGKIELAFTSGKKLVLMNVLHVPEIKKKLVSANLVCKNGIKAVLESDKLILSKNGVFVRKGYSCNGMFKLSINEIMPSTYIVESSSLWHDRLAHLNFSSLKFMSRNGFISYLMIIIKIVKFAFKQKLLKNHFQNLNEILKF